MTWRGADALYSARKLGHGANLKLCLDAGDSRSYSGSGQSWLDMSGGGYDFFLGSTSGAAANDPTFNGTAGNRSSSEYWSFDGGDFFTYDTTNESWMDAFHKDNAKGTILIAARLASFSSPFLCATCNLTFATIGFGWQISGTVMFFRVVGNAGAYVFNNAGDATLVSTDTGRWHTFAASFDEGANRLFLMQNGSVLRDSTFTFTSPSSAAASSAMRIAALTNGNQPFGNGSRLGIVTMLDKALSPGEVRAWEQAVRGRYGI